MSLTPAEAKKFWPNIIIFENFYERSKYFNYNVLFPTLISTGAHVPYHLKHTYVHVTKIFVIHVLHCLNRFKKNMRLIHRHLI